MQRIHGSALADPRLLGRLLLVALLAVAPLGACTRAARADGDPASDALIAQNLFVGWNAGVPSGQQLALGNFVDAANRRGLAIRVAVIGAPGDLGAITQLWRKPAAYASFLGVELSLIYKQRLLIVMPNGFGLNWPGHSTVSVDRTLAKIHVRPGAAGLVTATQAAVRALAASAGVTLMGSIPSAPQQVESARRAAPGPALPPLLIAVVAAAIAVGLAATGVAAAVSFPRRRGTFL